MIQTIQVAKASQLNWLETFYARRNYQGKIHPEDDVYYISQGKDNIAVVRLAREHNLVVLRGMEVDLAWQKKGLGTQLLHALSPSLNKQACYCIPWSHLEKFYAQAKFKRINTSELPQILRIRFNDYLSRNMDVIAMQRTPLDTQASA